MTTCEMMAATRKPPYRTSAEEPVIIMQYFEG